MNKWFMYFKELWLFLDQLRFLFDLSRVCRFTEYILCFFSLNFISFWLTFFIYIKFPKQVIIHHLNINFSFLSTGKNIRIFTFITEKFKYFNFNLEMCGGWVGTKISTNLFWKYWQNFRTNLIWSIYFILVIWL